MIAHSVTQILQSKFLIRDDPKGHLLGILLDTCSIRHIGREIIAEAIKEAPHTSLAIATT